MSIVVERHILSTALRCLMAALEDTSRHDDGCHICLLFVTREVIAFIPIRFTIDNITILKI
jgi:hypothetical protein